MFNDTIPVKKAVFGRFGAYVCSDDALFAWFTAREALTFSARLKLKTPDEEQDKLVEKIIFDLGLTMVAGSQIGSVMRKVLSGGERKRCAIGVELVSEPSVLMLDDPTAGLDSFKAFGIVQLLNRLARTKGTTVLSTINQPSSESFFYFDKLILMTDGHIVYQGDAKKSVDHFKLINRPIPRFANPADYFMKVLTVRYPKRPEDEANVADLARHYRTLNEGSVKAEMKIVKVPLNLEFDPDANMMADTTTQIRWLFNRSWLFAQREPRLTKAKFLQNFVTAVFMLTVFSGLGFPTKLVDDNGPSN